MDENIDKLIKNQEAIVERLNHLENFLLSNIAQLKNDYNFQSYQQFHTLQQAIYALSRKVSSQNRKPKIVFLIHHLQAFYNIEDVYYTFKNSEKVDTVVIAINNHFKDAMIAEGADEISKELKKKGIEHIAFNMENSYYALDILLAINPDYIFIQSPWDNDRPLALKVPYLMFAKILYVPYYPVTLVEHFKPEQDDLHFNSYVHNLAYRIYVQTDLDKKYFKKYQILKAQNIKVVGSTKLYKLKTFRGHEANHNSSKDFNLIWAPHHSIAQRWLGFGVFHSIYKDMTNFAKENTHIKILFKPHPFLRRALMEHQIMHKEEYDEWLKEFTSIENVSLYEGGDYLPIFETSDAMLTDGLSFLIEYPIATGNPLIFFDSKNHQPLNEYGNMALEYAYKVDSFEAFKEILNHLIKSKETNQKDKMYEKRKEALKKMEDRLVPKEDPTKIILEDVLNDWHNA